MSAGHGEYENYTVTSQNYDSTRVAFGVEVILGAFICGTKRPLRELHVLDAGCGTGNYTVALSEYVGKVTGLEMNEGMLGRAMEKTATLKNVSLTQGDITKMPFQDNQFDGICCNQVIHHLEAADAAGDFPKLKLFVSECIRVLKPGGCLLINVHTPEQATSKVMWYNSLLPEASKRQASRLSGVANLQGYLKDVGFNLGAVFVLTDMIFKPDHWLDKEGPFRQEWRNTDSIFSLATAEELEESLKWWRGKIDNGTADQYLKECEEERLKIGTSVSVVAHKPQQNKE